MSENLEFTIEKTQNSYFWQVIKFLETQQPEDTTEVPVFDTFLSKLERHYLPKGQWRVSDETQLKMLAKNKEIFTALKLGKGPLLMTEPVWQLAQDAACIYFLENLQVDETQDQLKHVVDLVKKLGQLHLHHTGSY